MTMPNTPHLPVNGHGNDDDPETETRTYRVVFQPSGRQGQVTEGTNLLDAARSLGVEIEAICSGRQTCGKCQISVAEGFFAKHALSSKADHLSPPDAREELYWRLHTHLPGRRLACACEVRGDLMINVPEESQARKQVVRKAAGDRAIVVDAAMKIYYVEVEEASLADPLGDWDRMARELNDRFGLADLRLDPILLGTLQATLHKGARKATVTVWQGREVVRVQPGYDESAYGLAVDIGTTTIALHLCDLRSGAVLATTSQMNPQVAYGEDLMSRVSYCDNREDGLPTLHGAVIDALNALAIEAATDAGITVDAITDAVLVGNSVMHHILLNIPPRELGQSPFAPAISDAVDIKARDLGLALAPGAWVHVLPVEAGHVGADNVAVILAEEPHNAPADQVWLIIDVGTNGELLLGNRERVYSASSPTGPAFEGAQIRHGMRAAPGAIERIRIDPETLDVNFKVIGREVWSRDWRETAAMERARLSETANPGLTAENTPDESTVLLGHKARRVPILAAGICGSGIIEAVAELFMAGVLTLDGRFAPEIQSPRLKWNGNKAEFVLAWPEQASTGRPIVITSDDVRAIQLAKAALYSGARLLMERFGVTKVDRVALAGAFGSYIDPLHAMVLGMIPDCDLPHVVAVGNAAGDGARIALLNAPMRQEARRLARWVTYVGIALEPRFQDAFVEAIPLPHGVDAFPHLADVLAAAATSRRSHGVPDYVSARDRRRARMAATRD
jgi:uncharacterized 2Fe-2S/4Fe-4S cluster protein (DUF4445 family)